MDSITTLNDNVDNIQELTSNYINTLLQSSTQYTEYEVSFGQYIKHGFKPGVSAQEFNNLRMMMSTAPFNTIRTIETVYRGDDNTNYRVIQSDSNTVYQQKYRDPIKHENRQWGFRVSASIETDIQSIPVHIESKKGMIRDKTRYRYDLHGAYLDVTVVRVNNKYLVYEVELEIDDVSKLHYIPTIIAYLQGTNDYNRVISIPDRIQVAAEINKLYKKEMKIELNQLVFESLQLKSKFVVLQSKTPQKTYTKVTYEPKDVVIDYNGIKDMLQSNNTEPTEHNVKLWLKKQANDISYKAALIEKQIQLILPEYTYSDAVSSDDANIQELLEQHKEMLLKVPKYVQAPKNVKDAIRIRRELISGTQHTGIEEYYDMYIYDDPTKILAEYSENMNRLPRGVSSKKLETMNHANKEEVANEYRKLRNMLYNSNIASLEMRRNITALDKLIDKKQRQYKIYTNNDNLDIYKHINEPVNLKINHLITTTRQEPDNLTISSISSKIFNKLDPSLYNSFNTELVHDIYTKLNTKAYPDVAVPNPSTRDEKRKLQRIRIKVFNMVKSILNNSLSEYAVTKKYDGIRRFLYFGNRGIFMFYPPRIILYIRPSVNVLTTEAIKVSKYQTEMAEILGVRGIDLADPKSKIYEMHTRLLGKFNSMIEERNIDPVTVALIKENLYATAEHMLVNGIDIDEDFDLDMLKLITDQILEKKSIIASIKQDVDNVIVQSEYYEEMREQVWAIVDYIYKHTESIHSNEYNKLLHNIYDMVYKHISTSDEDIGHQQKRVVASGILLDGEYMEDRDEFHVFDIQFYLNNNDVRATPFKNRYQDYLTKIASELSSNTAPKMSFNDGTSTFKMYLKRYFNYNNNVYDDINNAFNDIVDSDYATDGIILQPVNAIYKNDSTYKWKPQEQMTIDFVLHQNGDSYILQSYDETSNTNVTFRGTRKYPVIDDMRYYSNETGLDGYVGEFAYHGGEWKLLRWRFDKSGANKLSTAKDVWNDINDPLPLDVLLGKSNKIMFRYHNIIKRELLMNNLTQGSSILDMGSGQGGDVSKWKERGINVIAVEPDSSKLVDLNQRLQSAGYTENDNYEYEYNGNTVRILPNRIQDVNIDPVKEQLNALVSFFSLNFLSEQELDDMIRLINMTNPVTGKFVALVLNGTAVLEEFAEEGSNTIEASNDMWKIEKIRDDAIRITIKDSRVIQQEEYLLNVDNLINKLSNIGMKLEKRQNLSLSTLPFECNRLSSMYQLLVFKRTPISLSNNIRARTNARLYYYGDYVRYPALSSNNTVFITALLSAMSNKYNTLSDKDKLSMAIDFKNGIIESIDMNMFKSIDGGRYADNIVYNLHRSPRRRKIKQDPYEYAMNKFKESIRAQDTISEEMIEILQLVLHVNIVILSSKNGRVIPYKYLQWNDALPYYAFLNINDVHYESIGEVINDKIVRRMNAASSLITQITK